MTEKRAPGAGSIETLPSGNFRVRVRLASGKRYTSKPYPTREEAERHRDAVLVELGIGHAAVTGTITLRAWSDLWFKKRETDGLHRSVENERVLWAARVAKASFIDWPLPQITRRAVRAWVDEFSRSNVTAVSRYRRGLARRTLDRTIAGGTVRRTLGLLACCLQGAVDDELIPTNPARGISVRSAASTQESWTHLSEEEIRAVTTAPNVPEWARLLYTVAIFTGLRKGELWGLHWGDVLLDQPHPEAVVRYSHRGPTKTGKVARIPLLEPAVQALRRWREICPQSREDLVFPTLEGNRRLRNSDAGWSDSPHGNGSVQLGHKSKAGIARRVRFHDLRHTCASHLIMGTWGIQWTLDEVRSFLRHTTVAMTQRYAHLSPDHLHRRAASTRGPGVVLRALKPARTPAKDSLCIDEPNPNNLGGLDVKQAQAWPTRAAPIAEALLQITASGSTVPGALIDALVDSVLSEPLTALALSVRESAEHRLRRAIELASAVRRAADGATSKREVGRG